MSSKKPPGPSSLKSPAKKSSADYQREFRRRMREQGLVKKEVWIRPEYAKLLAIMERQLREEALAADTENLSLSDVDEHWLQRLTNLPVAASLPRPKPRMIDSLVSSTNQLKEERHFEATDTTNPLDSIEGRSMTNTPVPWTTLSMYEALKAAEPFVSGHASIEFIEGSAPALHLIMHEYGDLPVFVTVAGEQVIAESVLWSVDDVQNTALFNDAILRSHKYFPLSTISLDSVGDGRDYYYMFGALSSTSILSNIVFEIEVLAFNVIQAAEAYSEFLSQPAEAQG